MADGRRVKRLATIDLILEELHANRRTLMTPGVEQFIGRLLGPSMLSPDAQKQYVASVMSLLRVEAQSGKWVRIDLLTGTYKLLEVPTAETLPRPAQPAATKLNP